MINTRTDNLGDALRIGNEIKIEINKQFKNKKIEIEIEGILKPLLLVKKKKYAACKVVNLGEVLMNNGTVEPKFFREVKGLDMVRRNWCDLSKTCSGFVLDKLLTIHDKEDCMNELKDYFRKLSILSFIMKFFFVYCMSKLSL